VTVKSSVEFSNSECPRLSRSRPTVGISFITHVIVDACPQANILARMTMQNSVTQDSKSMHPNMSGKDNAAIPEAKPKYPLDV